MQASVTTALVRQRQEDCWDLWPACLLPGLVREGTHRFLHTPHPHPTVSTQHTHKYEEKNMNNEWILTEYPKMPGTRSIFNTLFFEYLHILMGSISGICDFCWFVWFFFYRQDLRWSKPVSNTLCRRSWSWIDPLASSPLKYWDCRHYHTWLHNELAQHKVPLFHTHFLKIIYSFSFCVHWFLHACMSVSGCQILEL